MLLLLGIYSKERGYNKDLFIEIIITVTYDVENSQTVSNREIAKQNIIKLQ